MEHFRAVQPETRYARAGDVSIAYQVLGDGPLDLVYIPGWISHLDLQWGDPAYARFLRRMAAFTRLILFDKRGVGLSDPVVGAPSWAERMEDVRAVMDAVGSERAALFGLSEGGPLAVHFAHRYPERTTHLVLYGTYAVGADLLEGGDHAVGAELLAALYDAVDNWGEGRSIDVFAPGRARSPQYREAWGRFERAAMSPRMARDLADAVAKVDVRPMLPELDVPTLVLHRVADHIPLAGARTLAQQIPGARLVELVGGAHAPVDGDVDALVDEVQEFLTGRRQGTTSGRAVVTVLVTDIVGSTERAAALGDAAWRDLLERHDAVVRDELRRHAGTEIKHTGDGFLAVFDGPTRALQCAGAVADGAREAGVEVRAGLHTGECAWDDGDLRGIAVHIAARIAAMAGPSEVLVTQTVRDLVIGSDTVFDDRGAHELKGVPGEWRVFAAGA